MSHQTVTISYIQTIPSFSYPHGDPGSLNLTVKIGPFFYTISFMTRRKDVQFGLSLFFFKPRDVLQPAVISNKVKIPFFLSN